MGRQARQVEDQECLLLSLLAPVSFFPPTPPLDPSYSLGEFRIPSHKTQVYDHNTRVPMLIKGPGIKAGSSLDIKSAMVDLGLTFIDLAGGKVCVVVWWLVYEDSVTSGKGFVGSPTLSDQTPFCSRSGAGTGGWQVLCLFSCDRGT